LEVAWRRFLDSNPYGIEIKTDINTGEVLYYLARDSSVPTDIPLIAGDAMQNLRSALDHVAYHLATIGPKGSVPPSKVYFPIFKSASLYQIAKDAGKIDCFRQDAIDAIDSIEPYGRGAGHILWILHEVNRIEKHRLLVATLADLTGHTALPSQLAKMSSDLSMPAEALKG
jgi:hypothetical protein